MYSKEEKKELTHRFWTNFDAYCSGLSFLKGKRKNWMLHRTKVANVHLRFDPGRDGASVAIEINHRDEDERLEMFEKIQQYRIILEEGFEGGLIWEYLVEKENEKQVCQISYKKNGLDIHKEEHWPLIYEFMALYMYKLEQNFLEIRDLINP